MKKAEAKRRLEIIRNVLQCEVELKYCTLDNVLEEYPRGDQGLADVLLLVSEVESLEADLSSLEAVLTNYFKN